MYEVMRLCFVNVSSAGHSVQHCFMVAQRVTQVQHSLRSSKPGYTSQFPSVLSSALLIFWDDVSLKKKKKKIKNESISDSYVTNLYISIVEFMNNARVECES